MVRGRDEAEWMRVQVSVRRLAALWVKDDPYPPRTWPHHVERKDAAVNAQRMESFLNVLDRQFGGK